MTIQNALASVAVKDVNSSARWYEKLLDQPASRPMPELAEWRFESGGGLQVYQLPERAGAGSLTLAVDDIDAQVARLEQLHIDTGNRFDGEQADGERVRTVMITDPDGNHIAFAQAIDPRLAQ